jgi:uncharacterized membrane protein YeiH
VDLSASDIIGVLDRVGIVAFAFSGVEVGARRRLDVFGLLVMGVVTATGGGVMRDVILGRIPLALERPDYLLFAVASAAVAILFLWRNRRVPRALVGVADAAGLGAFAAAGALAAIETDLSVVGAVLMAMLTATGGGVLRDLLASRVPLVLRSEINATAAGLGGLCVWLLEPVSVGLAAVLGVAIAAGLRLAGLALGLNLPRPGSREGRQKRLL